MNLKSLFMLSFLFICCNNYRFSPRLKALEIKNTEIALLPIFTDFNINDDPICSTAIITGNEKINKNIKINFLENMKKHNFNIKNLSYKKLSIKSKLKIDVIKTFKEVYTKDSLSIIPPVGLTQKLLNKSPYKLNFLIYVHGDFNTYCNSYSKTTISVSEAMVTKGAFNKNKFHPFISLEIILYDKIKNEVLFYYSDTSPSDPLNISNNDVQIKRVLNKLSNAINKQ